MAFTDNKIFLTVANNKASNFKTASTSSYVGTLGMVDDSDSSKPGSFIYNGKEYGMSYSSTKSMVDNKIQVLSKADYDKLSVKDSNVIYFVQV